MSNMFLHNASVWTFKHHMRVVSKICTRLLRIIYSCDIQPTAKIDQSVTFSHHGLGVVIGFDTIIGAKSKIMQNVTIGGRSGIRANPIIGENVLIGAGACILGGVTIGNNAKIGANAVVLEDVPENCTAVGVPARIIVRESTEI